MPINKELIQENCGLTIPWNNHMMEYYTVVKNECRNYELVWKDIFKVKIGYVCACTCSHM